MPRSSLSRLDKHIGVRLRTLRTKLGLSMEVVGEIIEVSPQQIFRFEHGQQRLSASQIYQLSRGLDVPISWFFIDYQEEKNELTRLQSFIDRNVSKWSAQTDKEMEKALLIAWRTLSTKKQKESVLNMIESYS